MVTSFILTALLLSVSSATQCSMIQDKDRRSFDELHPIRIDVDGDGKPDTITPRTYTVRTKRTSSAKYNPGVKLTHWISFDIKTSKSIVIKSFFKYRYGDNLADYWVYALVPCQSGNKKGKVHLEFYSGDDTSDETVALAMSGNKFMVVSRKRSEADASVSSRHAMF